MRFGQVAGVANYSGGGLPYLPFAPLAGCTLLALNSEHHSALWLMSGVALAICVRLLNMTNAFVLLSIVGVFWFGIAADLLSGDIVGTSLASSIGGDYRTYVVQVALLALVVMASGMAFGLARSARTAGVHQVIAEAPLDLRRCLMLYALTALAKIVLGFVPGLVPSLAQPILGFMKIHYVSLYLLAYCVFRSRNGFVLLASVFASESVVGMTGFISSFQPVVITIGIAAFTAESREKLLASAFRLGIIIAAAIWLSTLWTAMKPAYRDWVNGGTGEQITIRSLPERVNWIVAWIIDGPKPTVNQSTHSDPLLALVQRMGYTTFFALVAQRADDGLLEQLPPRWQSAVLHIITPRILFDKAPLDDTVVTTLLTGLEFGRHTSVSVGYLGEAYADYGFPLVLAPMFFLGVLLGYTAGYFTSRNVRPELGRAFAVGAVVFTFQFGGNIDKELGGFVTGLIALIVVHTFAGRRINAWISSPTRAVAWSPHQPGAREAPNAQW